MSLLEGQSLCEDVRGCDLVRFMQGTILIWVSAGVLPFAKRGDDRGNNLVRLQQMFPRIVAADFEQPNHVTPECRHLLKRTLTADPDKRITIPEIMRHPWFQVIGRR